MRQQIAASKFAPVAALPARLGAVARHNSHQLASSARWLARSREHTNYTYDLEPLNMEHLAWFVADITGSQVGDVRSVMSEIESNSQFADHLASAAASAARRGLTDARPRLGRRIGWYALVRLAQPALVVETGTDKGLGTCVLAAAILRNGVGRVTTIDINPTAGSLITPPYSQVVDAQIGDSITALSALDRIDLFLHDSDHSVGHETAELSAAEPRLNKNALVISDNAHVTGELAAWAEVTGRRFDYFAERPRGHWYPGGGIGVASPRA